ncbi:MAG: alpha/beta hydrolase [Gemmatimonas sp.]
MATPLATLRQRCALTLLAISLAVSACVHAPTRSTAVGARVDTLWYATSRQRDGQRLGYKQSDSLEFGYYLLASRRGADVMRDGLDLRIVDSARLTQATFLSAIAPASTDAGRYAVLSIHGYATNHAKAVRDAGESFIRSGIRQQWIVYSWPSNGRGMLLLQPSRFFLANAYRADSTAAVKAKPAFARLLQLLHAAVGGSHLTITTHSLGAQIAADVLAADSTTRAALKSDPLRAVGFFEPDISLQRFRERVAPMLDDASRRTALYASRNDGMLRFSRLVNNAPRAGLLDLSASSIDNVETIDVTGGETAEDWFRRRFGTHHAMKKESGALRDFFDIVVAGESPACRLKRGTADLRAVGVWTLLPVRAAGSPC